MENTNIYNITTENEVAILLSRFDPQYIYDIIQDSLNMKFNLNFVTSANPNMVEAFERTFKDMQQRYPSDAGSIEEKRIASYKQIISILCNHYGLQFIDTGDVDYHALAYYLYDFLSANYSNYLTYFFTAYIYKEKNALYNAFNMDSLKKNKDSATLYGKKAYNDAKMAVLNANLDIVIRNMCSFDISFDTILNFIYPNKYIINILLTNIVPVNDFFKYSYGGAVNSDAYPTLLGNIRMSIHKMITDIENNNINNGGN